MPDDYRDRHVLVRGMTGSGKTGWLNGIIMQDIINGYHSVVVIDPLGASLVSTIVDFLGMLNMRFTLMSQTGRNGYDERVRHFRDFLLNRIVVIDFADIVKSNRFFNPLKMVSGLMPDECGGQLLKTFENASGADLDTQLLRQLNLKAAFSLVSAAGGTVLDCPRFYGLDRQGFNRFIEYLTNKAESEGQTLGLAYVRQYAEKFIAGVDEGRERREREQSCWTALNLFLGDERVRRFISAHNIDFDDIINGGKILLVNIPQGTDLNTLKILGQMIVDRVRLTCERRTKEQRKKKVSLICDEFHLLFGPSWAESIATVRNTGLNLIIAHQNAGQLQTSEYGEHLLNSMMENTSTQVFFRLGVQDSNDVAFSVFRPRGDKLRRQYVEISKSRGKAEAQSKAELLSETHGRSNSRGRNSTTATANAVSVGFGENETVTKSHADAKSEGRAKGKNRMRSSSRNHGIAISKVESEMQTTGIGNAHAVSHADASNSSSGSSSGTSDNSGASTASFNSFNSGSNSTQHFGVDTALGAVAASSGQGYGSNSGTSESHGTNDGAFSSQGQSTMDGFSDVDSTMKSSGKGTARGKTINSSVAFGEAEGESETENHGRTETDGIACSRGRNKNIGVARSKSVAEGTSKNVTETESHGTSTSTGETHTDSESTAETEKTEYYNVNDQARVMSYELMDLSKRQAYVIMRENGEVTRIRTHDIPYEYNNVFGGVDYTADFLNKIRPKETPEIPEDTVFDRIEAERRRKNRRNEPKEF